MARRCQGFGISSSIDSIIPRPGVAAPARHGVRPGRSGTRLRRQGPAAADLL